MIGDRDECFTCMSWRDHKTCLKCMRLSVKEGDAYRDGVWKGIQWTVLVACVVGVSITFVQWLFK